MAFKAFILPPRHLTALILGITVIPLATLLWLGWKLLEQDRILEVQQAQERLERAADLVAAALQRAISVSAQRLAAGETQWPEGAVAVTFDGDRLEAYPRERLAFFPVAASLPEEPRALFETGEELEFQRDDRAAAEEFFRELSQSPDPAMRAGALLRLGNNLSRAGRIEDALAVYGQLAAIDGVASAGVPLSLIGRYALCELLEKTGRSAEFQAEAGRLAEELHSARWMLTSSVYWLYAEDAARWTGSDAPDRRQAEVFAGAVEQLWERWRSLAVSGQESMRIGEEELAVIWQRAGDSTRALIAASAFVQSQWLAAAAPVAQEQRIRFHTGDSASDGAALTTVRAARETALPWSIVVTNLDSPAMQGGFVLRRRLLVAGFLLLVSMALAASALVVRAVRRELAVARLQSDFVSAVSHEFRTPLTALRQFTDMLRDNTHLDEDRRTLCYDAQSRATDRLTRLVESLLDFGRLEAGVYLYRFADRDCTQLVGRVVDDFRAEARAAGYAVEFHGNGSAAIQADGEALGRAIWNLLDNAVKYSQDRRTVDVGLSRSGPDMRIAVRDYGIGIPAGERTAIFSKFHRGEQARTRGIKGTGIGLAMAAEIVKAHRGRIEVDSEPGVGSTFTIVLPTKG